jgi:hypothetical protein
MLIIPLININTFLIIEILSQFNVIHALGGVFITKYRLNVCLL